MISAKKNLVTHTRACTYARAGGLAMFPSQVAKLTLILSQNIFAFTKDRGAVGHPESKLI